MPPTFFNPQPVPEITALDLHEKLAVDSSIIIVDVRETYEHLTGIIPSALLMPLSRFTEHLQELPHDKKIVCVCAVGERSAAAAAILQRSGYQDVNNLAGGMSGWHQNGFQVVLP